MTLDSISILNYKNIADAQLKFSDKVNCFTGRNGMGKTNMLDAIYYLSFTKSFTRLADSMVVRDGSDYMMLQGRYTRRGEEEEISLGLQSGKRKSVKRNGKEYKRLSMHIGLLPAVMVSPLDWELIRGGSDERRRLMDMIISQSDKQYLEHVIRYGKCLENRNSMLKKGFRDPLLFESIEVPMAESARYIHQARKTWIAAFLPIFNEYYNSISGGAEAVNLIYESTLNDKSFESLLNASRERDAAVGYTTEGVHRDDIELLLNGRSMRKSGSQGQCKTYTIALRLAQYEFLRAASGDVKPILLLDDIFDKLDASRVENIISIVSMEKFGQIFITDTDRTYIDATIRKVAGDNYRIFSVENGVCSEFSENAENV